jgi:phosphate/sulfate permease
MAKQMAKTLKKMAGVAVSILCAPLAPLVIAYYLLYARLLLHLSKKTRSETDHRKQSRVKTMLFLLSHLVALSSLNVPLAVAVFTKARGKLVSHVFATYVTLAFIAACELGSLKCPSPARSR